MKTNLAFACAAAFLLTACGSSGSGSGGTIPTQDLTLPQIAERFDLALDAVSRDVDDAPVPTNFADIRQNTGTVYTGAAAIITEDITFEDNGGTVEETSSLTSFFAMGAATMNVNSTFSSVSVTANNFYEIDGAGSLVLDTADPDFSTLTGDRIGGSVSSTLDQVSTRVNAYTGQLTGSLATNSGALDIDLPAGGFFSGNEGDAFVLATIQDLPDPTTPQTITETFGVIFVNRD